MICINEKTTNSEEDFLDIFLRVERSFQFWFYKYFLYCNSYVGVKCLTRIVVFYATWYNVQKFMVYISMHGQNG